MNFVYWLVAVVAILGPIMAANRAYKKGLQDGQEGFRFRSIVIRRYHTNSGESDTET